ncbi:MAG: hypothetical protein COB60_04795 [Flavobacteriaceae bacterium]|nr:MAG: hypothetical protein COB60_04795 [Flavobacteriaceae bacterium]
MKLKFTIILFILCTISSFSQVSKIYKFGKVSQEELNLKYYAKDSTANALVLYESGITQFKEGANEILIETKIYKRIKIFNKKGFDHASFSINLYNNKSRKETLKNLKAICYNNGSRSVLSSKKIFTNKINERWTETVFTMPNVQAGSVIEVSYTLRSPFKFNLTGWEFQSDIPKVLSEYKASIPGNYTYNRVLNGFQKLKVNSSVIKKNCFSVSWSSGTANCEDLHYSMEYIPAFVEEEYMTSKENFLSKIKFELKEFLWFDGSKQKYTSTWKAVDKEFRKDKNIGGQLKKEAYFKKRIPAEILSKASSIEKAKEVFYFIQNHYAWNQKYRFFQDINIKKAFEKKTGNINAINLSLITSLRAAGFDCQLVLLSTRKNGKPTTLHPVISDFNYLVGRLTINNKTYLLDATNKLNKFGILPFKCLNGIGRVMDFKNDSFWINLEPVISSKQLIHTTLKLSPEGIISGKTRTTNYGYNALDRRVKIDDINQEDLIDNLENENDFEISNYVQKNTVEFDKPFIEEFNFIIAPENTARLYLNPFFKDRFTKNPFKSKERLYPVDFGYKKKYQTNITVHLPDNYVFESIPKTTTFKLLNNTAVFSLTVENKQPDRLTMNCQLKMNKTVFNTKEYNSLKQLLSQIIKSQNEPIIIKKII